MNDMSLVVQKLVYIFLRMCFLFYVGFCVSDITQISVASVSFLTIYSRVRPLFQKALYAGALELGEGKVYKPYKPQMIEYSESLSLYCMPSRLSQLVWLLICKPIVFYLT